MKKSLIFWFAAVTCAAWILVGCEQEAKTETNTVTKGAAADIEGLQALLAEPGVNQVTYYGNLTIDGGKLVSVPEGKTLTVTGGITLETSADVLVVAGGLNFTGTIDNSGVVIGVAADKVSGGTTGAIVSGPDDPKIGTVSAMKDYTLTSNVSAIPSSLTLYVYGTLTVNADSVAPTGGGKVVAIGTVTLAGDNAAALADAAKVDVGNATITYGGTSTVAITLPATLSSPTFKVTGNGGVLKVAGTTNITANVTANNGYVEFAAAVTQATIIGGGRVRFLNATTPTAFATAASSITASVIEFTNGLSTATSAPLTLSGAVYIPDTKAITFGHADGKLTLEKGSAIYAGTPGGTGTAKVLEATATAVLTPVQDAALTAAVSTKTLTLGTAGLTLTSGTLAVETGATFVGDDLTVKGTLIADGTVKTSDGTNSVAITKATVVGDETTGAVFAAAGTLTLAATDQLVLADGGSVTTAGTGKVTVGTTFELNGAGTWTAGTDTVTFAGTASNTGTITGGTSATLTPSGTTPALKLLAATNAQALTIGGTTQFTLDLSAAGKIIFDNTVANSTITLTANSDGIKLTESLAIVGTGDASGSPFTGAFVDGTGEYNASTLNVSLIDGIIKHSTTSAAKPEQIDKNTAAASLASADS